MKKQITKIFKINSINRNFLIASALLLAITVPIQLLTDKKASATCSTNSECENVITTLNNEIKVYQDEIERLNSEAQTLQNELGKINSQKNILQAQIDANQAKYDQLVIEIAETEKLIKENQDALGKTIADMYVDDEVTPLEMIAGSSNISDYLDKQEYRTAVRDQLTVTISKVKELKSSLDQQKTDVDKVLSDQKTQRDTLIAKQNEQQWLLNQTNGQEAQYQDMIGDNESAISEAKATQAIISARISNSGGYVLVDAGSLGDYPWDDSNCPMWGYLSTGGYDGNGGDGRGYGCRQCASYVAWRFAKETGIYPSWGNAVNFTNGATSLGFTEGLPKKGSIAVMDPAKAGQSYGHVAWVESDPVLDSNGRSVVLVSQYNYDFGWGYGYYSSMWLSVGAFDHYINIK